MCYLEFKEYPIELLKDIAIFGNYQQRELFNSMIFVLEKDVDDTIYHYFLISHPENVYAGIYDKDTFMYSMIDRGDFPTYIKMGYFITNFPKGELRIKKGYTYNPDANYKEMVKIIEEIF